MKRRTFLLGLLTVVASAVAWPAVAKNRPSPKPSPTVNWPSYAEAY
jgi:hypothetical protein